MKGFLGGLALYTALAAEGHAQPPGPEIDVAAALERIRDTGVFPEYHSLEYVDLHRAVKEIVERDPHGYVAELAGRVLTRVVVYLDRPLMSSDEQPFLTTDLYSPPGVDRIDQGELQGSLDGGPWRFLTQLGSAQQGPGVCDLLGAAACAPGWHLLAVRAVLSASSGPGAEPIWVETRELRTLGYGIYRTSELGRSSMPVSDAATPAAWMRTVLEAPASLIDSQLPPVPLPLWLASTLRAAGQPGLAHYIIWESGHCTMDMVERFQDRSRAAPCITADAGHQRSRLHLEFSLGSLIDETGLRRSPEMPTLHYGHLVDDRGTLDISSLSDLGAAFTKPRKTWPVADLRVSPTDILYSPLVPNPGDAVTVEFTVHNDGRQDARAMIEYWLNAAGLEKEERVDFTADVPAGQYYRFTRSIRLPMGSGTGWAGLHAKQVLPPRGSLKLVDETNRNNNDAVRLLGALRIVGVPD